MGLREHGEAVHAVVVDDRHQDHVVGRVRIAVVGRVVEEGVAPLQLRVKLLHRGRHDVGAAQHVDRVALGRRDQLAIGRDDAAREVPRHVEHAGAPRAQQRVCHLRGHALEALRQHREADAVEGPLRTPLAVSFLATVPVSLYVCPFISTIRLPFAERTTDAPGSMTTVVKLDSTIAGPSTRSPAAIACKADARGHRRALRRGSRRRGVQRSSPSAAGSTARASAEPADGAARPRAPRHRFDVRLPVGHGEHFFVQVVEVRHNPLDVLWPVEAALRQRHLDLPDLVRVAGLDRELDALIHPGGAAPFEERPGTAPPALKGSH